MSTLDLPDRLDADEIAAVRALVERVTAADGTAPLSEHVLLHLSRGGDPQAHNLLLREDGRLVGYAHLDTTDTVNGPSAELTVDPQRRGRGLGAELLEAVCARAGTGQRIRLWAHGVHPGAAALAERFGFSQVRALWQMRRSLYAPLPPARYPDGVRLRTFRPGQDEAEWVRVNALAFTGLPDQGGWTLADLTLREAEPWFDPAGFFLAERGERLVGFHWTKVHGEEGSGPHGHEPIGEVYVVGVDPAEQGGGLGKALTLTGLAHLRARGLGSAMLYVDEDNTGAIALYDKLGFIRWDTDVTYQRGPLRH